MAIVVGVMGMGLSLVGAYHAWRERRVARAKRLTDAAAIAVRRVEATYVRPILQQRLEAAVHAWRREVPIAPADGGGSSRDDRAWWRMCLFCRLQREVRLNADEKTEARRRGVDGLVTTLRDMPSPPLRVHTERQRRRAAGTLAEQIEGAFQLRPRASTTLITEFNAFCPVAGVPMPCADD